MRDRIAPAARGVNIVSRPAFGKGSSEVLLCSGPGFASRGHALCAKITPIPARANSRNIMAQNRKSRRAAAAQGASKGPAPTPAQPAAAAPASARATRTSEDVDLKRAFQIGLAHYGAGRHAHAEIVFRRVVAILEKGVSAKTGDVTLAQALNALGVIMRVQNRYRDAIALYERALALDPGNAGVFSNLGNALKDDHELDGAIEAHRRALALTPNDAKINHNLGVSLVQAGRFAEGIEAYDRALALDPAFADAAWDRARALLYLGDFKRGWPAYEARWDLAEQKGRKRPGTTWRGEDFAGKRLFIYGEQGFGDSIQCMRYLPQVKARGGTVIFECQPTLMPLAEGLGADELVPRMPGTSAPEHDLIIPLLSLPELFSPDLASIPATVPYLRAPPGRAAKLAPFFARAQGKLKVGIVWSGSVTFKGNRDRALRLATFLRYFSLPNVQLYSLQKGPPEVESTLAPADAPIIDLAPHLGDFADTAAAIDGLDLVLMTDSAVAHLAGAMGRPVWVLISFVAHWLWLAEREDSPWYPSMRFFRQTRPGEWGPVMERARAELAALAAGDKTRLLPKT